MTSKRHYLSKVDEEERTAQCNVCGPVQVLSNGTVNGKRYWRCQSKRQNDLSEEKREYLRQYARDYQVRTGGVSQRKGWLKKAYGMTVEEYEALLARQEEKCAICRKPCHTGGNLSVDHDHDTGRVRGLLCRNCNRGIGLLQESPEILQAAIQYLA
jgi:hypothetical protein